MRPITLVTLLTAGLTVHGFHDYEQGTKLPSLVEVLEGKNQDRRPRPSRIR